jgi:hypothetical protein
LLLDIDNAALNSVIGVRLFLDCITCDIVFSDDDHRSIFCFVLAISDRFFCCFLVLFTYDNIEIYIRYVYDAFFSIFAYVHIRTHTQFEMTDFVIVFHRSK